MAAHKVMITKGQKCAHPKHGVCEYISTPMCRNDGRDMAQVRLQDGSVKGVLLKELTEVKPAISSMMHHVDSLIEEFRKFTVKYPQWLWVVFNERCWIVYRQVPDPNHEYRVVSTKIAEGSWSPSWEEMPRPGKHGCNYDAELSERQLEVGKAYITKDLPLHLSDGRTIEEA